MIPSFTISSSQTARDLSRAVLRLYEETGWHVRVGAELEWYFGVAPSEALLVALEECMRAVDLPKFVLEKERGSLQYEWALPPVEDPIQLAGQVMLARAMIQDRAAHYGNLADFRALPDPSEPGSGLHVHVNLWNDAGDFPFEKEVGASEESSVMLSAIAGLLARLQESLPMFCPDPQGYARYRRGFLAPSTISWGGNNRTVALRIPDSTLAPCTRRIEHRVPSADADPFLVLSVILEAIRCGVLSRAAPDLPKIYGDAAQAQYGMLPIVVP